LLLPLLLPLLLLRRFPPNHSEKNDFGALGSVGTPSLSVLTEKGFENEGHPELFSSLFSTAGTTAAGAGALGSVGTPSLSVLTEKGLENEGHPELFSSSSFFFGGTTAVTAVTAGAGAVTAVAPDILYIIQHILYNQVSNQVSNQVFNV
jgi:hypothetical protein